MKKLLWFLAVVLSFGMVFAEPSTIQTQADTLFTLADQVITWSKNPDQTRETVRVMFISCAKDHQDITIRGACRLVAQRLWADLPAEETTQSTSSTTYRLESIVDGDTIKIADEKGQIISVRMIGIDAPESNTTRYGYAECFGKEAKTHLEELLRGEDNVQLEFDTTQGNYDKYNRLLAYVISRGTNINKKMIDDGFAFEYTYNLPYNYQSEFKTAQKDATLSGRGLRAGSACQGQRVKDTRNEPTDASSASSSSSSYEPSNNSDNSSSPYSYIAPLKSTYGSDWRTYYTGPRGGCYYINSNGNKTYVAHSYCSTDSSNSSSSSNYSSSSSYSSDHVWHTWPRWGVYYINSHGNKTYRKRK